MSSVAATRRFVDTHEGFGVVSRFFHWSMALLLAWQFTSAIVHLVAEDTALDAFFFGTHYSVGFTIFLLVFLRGAWGLANVSHRPPHAGGGFERFAATTGQVVLYGLMVVVPAIMIYRAVASGRGFRAYGVQLVQPDANPAPAADYAAFTTVHVLFGWAFLAFVVIHIALAIYHGYVRRDATLDRMTKGASDKPLNPAGASKY